MARDPATQSVSELSRPTRRVNKRKTPPVDIIDLTAKATKLLTPSSTEVSSDEMHKLRPRIPEPRLRRSARPQRPSFKSSSATTPVSSPPSFFIDLMREHGAENAQQAKVFQHVKSAHALSVEAKQIPPVTPNFSPPQPVNVVKPRTTLSLKFSSRTMPESSSPSSLIDLTKEHVRRDVQQKNVPKEPKPPHAPSSKVQPLPPPAPDPSPPQTVNVAPPGISAHISGIEAQLLPSQTPKASVPFPHASEVRFPGSASYYNRWGQLVLQPPPAPTVDARPPPPPTPACTPPQVVSVVTPKPTTYAPTVETHPPTLPTPLFPPPPPVTIQASNPTPATNHPPDSDSDLSDVDESLLATCERQGLPKTLSRTFNPPPPPPPPRPFRPGTLKELASRDPGLAKALAIAPYPAINRYGYTCDTITLAKPCLSTRAKARAGKPVAKSAIRAKRTKQPQPSKSKGGVVKKDVLKPVVSKVVKSSVSKKVKVTKPPPPVSKRPRLAKGKATETIGGYSWGRMGGRR